MRLGEREKSGINPATRGMLVKERISRKLSNFFEKTLDKKGNICYNSVCQWGIAKR